MTCISPAIIFLTIQDCRDGAGLRAGRRRAGESPPKRELLRKGGAVRCHNLNNCVFLFYRRGDKKASFDSLSEFCHEVIDYSLICV